MCPGEETIAAYLAGQLPPHEREALDSHVDTCSACQELVAALAKLQPRDDATLADAGADPGITGGILGRYVLLARLGAGGMGMVYAAYDPELDRRVAIKILHRARAGAELRDEARAIARLAHPNVIAVHDVGEADGEVFVAMEHVEGVTVREWLRSPRETTQILEVFVQAGRGLAAAHRAGLVHRDVKPSNIIIGSDGRARVLDFGLARGEVEGGEVAGTPAYMAPEQRDGARIDARADQYAFCVALRDALGAGASERVERAIARGTSRNVADRFPTMDDLLVELEPPSRGRRGMIATALGLAASIATLAVVVATRDGELPSCARAGDPLDRVWSPRERAAVAAAFAATRLPYATTAAASTIEQLDRWGMRWQAQAAATCRATVIDKVQPAATHALRTRCLDDLLERLRSVVVIVRAPDAEVVARAATLAPSLPAPERCSDGATLGAVVPPPEGQRGEVDALRTAFAANETALLAGRAPKLRDEILALRARAAATSYLPAIARADLLVGKLELSSARYAEGIAALHAAARAATAARDLDTLAESWIELSQALGNDPRTYDEALLFDGYAEALIAQLAARSAYELQLAFARCNRNVDSARAADVAQHCEQVIARALPSRVALANAARVRLGHFQRLQGKEVEARASLELAVEEAVAAHGDEHPDVAVAKYSLGIAAISRDELDAGIALLREALAIRERAFLGDNLQTAESLVGLGDALGASGKHDEAIANFERAIAMLERLRQARSAQAANAHILAGMSLQEVKRLDDALAHFVRAADIADRSLQHREAIAAMALRLAAGIENARDRVADGIPHIERAVRLLERGKVPPRELGQTQFLLARFLFAVPRERARATAMLAAARASFVAAGEAGASQLAELEAFSP